MPYHDTQLDPVFRALADPTRRAVLQRLSRGKATVSELAAPFEMALPSFLQHLKVLEEGGLVTTRKQGRVREVEMQPAPLKQAAGWLEEQRALWEARFDRLEAVLAELQAPSKEDDPS